MSLVKAVKEEDVNKVRELLENGISPNLKTSKGTPVLIEAINQENTEIVKLLLDAGADPNIKNADGDTPLHVASENGNSEYIDMLLEHGAEINVQGKYGLTPITVASAFGSSVPNVIKLLEAGANPNIQDDDGMTPLMYTAMMNGEDDGFSILLAKGANPNLQDIYGNSALSFACRANEKNKVSELLSHGEIQNTIDRTGHSILEYALRGAFSEEINEMIIEKFRAVEQGSRWTGFTKSDIEKFDTIFEASAKDYSFCPVCLNYLERSEACNYMSHDCRGRGGIYHEALYDTYKNDEGKIYWCTICGRICLGHRHYELVPSTGPKGNLVVIPPIQQANVHQLYEEDCRLHNGGGGLPEKYVRFGALVEKAHEIMNTEVTTKQEALNKLVEAAWNAPVGLKKENLNRIEANLQAKKPFRKNFPTRLEEVAEVNEAVREFRRPEPNASNASLQPIVHEVGENSISGDDEGSVIQFRHKMKNGVINNHIDRYISPSSLETLLEMHIKNFSVESSIYCWEYPSCTALLYPEEVRDFVSTDVYERYKAMFDSQMTKRKLVGGRLRKTRKGRKGRKGMQRGGQQEDFFREATNAVCVLPPKPRIKGGRRHKTRRRGGRKGKGATSKRKR